MRNLDKIVRTGTLLFSQRINVKYNCTKLKAVDSKDACDNKAKVASREIKTLIIFISVIILFRFNLRL